MNQMMDGLKDLNTLTPIFSIKLYCTVFKRHSTIQSLSRDIYVLAGFRANSEIIGKFRKLKKFYDHFVKREK